jgi:hypothetical protein
MPDKQLPTRTDAIAVRTESLPTPEGKTERRELRTANSKTFLHAEKAGDGKEIRTCHATIGAVCYVSDDGSLRSIDTTIRDLDGVIGVEWAPYRFTLHSAGIGFDFESREGGNVSVKLIGIGGDKFASDVSLKPEIEDNVVTFPDVRPGCDIVFKCLNQRVKTLRILRDANAPRTFDWQVESDKPELIDSTLTGNDATGNDLELVATVDGDVVHEEWTGKTKVIADPATRIKSLSDDVIYPVDIDPTVAANEAVAGDDGCENSAGASWSGGSNINVVKFAGTTYHGGARVAGLTVPQGSTISSATLTVKVKNKAGSGSNGTVTARAHDDAPQFGSGADLPSAVSKTTATATIDGTTLGIKSIGVTAIIQEIVNRAGWASGGHVAFPVICAAGSYTNGFYLTSYEDSGTDEPSLSVTYTAAAGGTAGNLLLLGCG